MSIDRSQLLDYLDKIARYLINEGIIKTDDMTNEEVFGYVVETVSALRERVAQLEDFKTAVEETLELHPSHWEGRIKSELEKLKGE